MRLPALEGDRHREARRRCAAAPECRARQTLDRQRRMMTTGTRIQPGSSVIAPRAIREPSDSAKRSRLVLGSSCTMRRHDPSAAHDNLLEGYRRSRAEGREAENEEHSGLGCLAS